MSSNDGRRPTEEIERDYTRMSAAAALGRSALEGSNLTEKERAEIEGTVFWMEMGKKVASLLLGRGGS